MTVGEEAVKAAQKAYRECEGDATESHRAALTAALPHLPGVRSAARKELMKQIREGTAHGFLNDGSQPEGNPDLDCPYCCGSGHKGDIHSSAARELALEEAAKIAFDVSENGEYHGEASVDSASSIYQQGAFEAYEAIRALGTSREQLNKAVSNVPDQQENEPGAHGERERALEEAVRKHLKWFERFICDHDELNSSTPRKVAQNAQDAAAELRAALSSPVHADAGKLVEGNGRADLETFWRPISEADKSITFEQTFDTGDGKSMTIRNSDHYWVRDADGRVYEATWSDHKGGYWWDLEGESPVDPIEYMPHPLSLPTPPAGKVEGDGWLPSEYEVYCDDEWVAASNDLREAMNYAANTAGDGVVELVEVRRRTLPSAPSQEVA